MTTTIRQEHTRTEVKSTICYMCACRCGIRVQSQIDSVDRQLRHFGMLHATEADASRNEAKCFEGDVSGGRGARPILGRIDVVSVRGDRLPERCH